MSFPFAILLAALMWIMRIAFIVFIIYFMVSVLKNMKNRKQKEKIYSSISQTIKEHRERCGMTQEFVAQELGISRQAVSKWESGKSEPSTSNLIALSKLYGVSPEELIKGII